MVRDDPGRQAPELLLVAIALEVRGGIRTTRISEPAMLRAIPRSGGLDIVVGTGTGIESVKGSRVELDGDDGVMGDMSDIRA